MARVLVVGSLQLRVATHVDRLPGPGETATGSTARRAVGGRGVDQALAARRAGAEVVMVGAVGDDDAGRWCDGALFDAGVDARLQVVGHQPTGFALTARDAQGSESTVVVPGANAALDGDEAARALEPGDIVLVHLEVPLPVVALVASAADRIGARLVVNASPFAALPHDTAALADPLVVGEREAVLLADVGLLPSSLCATFGPAGAVWEGLRVDGTALGAVPGAPTPAQVDVFCGTLAAALAADLDRPAALRQAVAATSAR